LFSAFGDESSAVHGCRFVWNEKKQDYVMEDARGPSTGTHLVEVAEAEPLPMNCFPERGTATG
jgi:hypothetical protein